MHLPAAVHTALTVVAVSAGVALAGCAAPDDSIDEAAPPQIAALAPDHPASVPDDFVVTPMGFFHPSCVRDTSERAIAAATPCQHPHYDYAGNLIAPFS